MISRRRFALTALASGLVPGRPGLAHALEPAPTAGWRTFRVTTRIDLVTRADRAQAWVPLAGFADADWVRPQGDTWTTSANAQAERTVAHGASLLHVRWNGDGPRFAEVTSTVMTRDRATPGTAAAPRALSADERAHYLAGSPAAPTDGPIKALADTIVAGAPDDHAKARAIYDWVVLHTFRSAATPGCGDGDIVRMLKSGVLGGKCADINPLFVALARAAGIPARDLYGLRVAPSRLGYASLGPKTPDVTKAQHCRAEIFLDGLGWTAMDPADVRKVMLEETPGGLPLEDPRVAAARARLFGAWEGNWVPFNATDALLLPGREQAPINFLMYPQVESAGALHDCYHPNEIRYRITAEELAI